MKALKNSLFAVLALALVVVSGVLFTACDNNHIPAVGENYTLESVDIKFASEAAERMTLASQQKADKSGYGITKAEMIAMCQEEMPASVSIVEDNKLRFVQALEEGEEEADYEEYSYERNGNVMTVFVSHTEGEITRYQVVGVAKINGNKLVVEISSYGETIICTYKLAK